MAEVTPEIDALSMLIRRKVITADLAEADECCGLPRDDDGFCFHRPGHPIYVPIRPNMGAAAVLKQHVRLSCAERPFICTCEPHVSDGTQSHHAHVLDELLAEQVNRPGQADQP